MGTLRLRRLCGKNSNMGSHNLDQQQQQQQCQQTIISHSGGKMTRLAGKILSVSCVVLLVKLSIILVCLAVTIWQAQVALDRFLSRQTSTILAVKPTGEETFLTMTICPAFGYAYKDELLKTYGTDRTTYAAGNYSTPSTNLDARAVYGGATYGLHEVVKSVVISSADEDESEVESELTLHQKGNWTEGKLTAWFEKYETLYGVCYSLDILPSLSAKGITDIVFETSVNTYIFLHHPGQFMHINTKTKIPCNLAEMIFIDINYEMTTDTLGADAEIPCSDHMNMKLDDCLEKNVPRQLQEEFNCTVPYLPGPEDIPLCDANDEVLLKKVMSRYDFLVSNGQDLLCKKPCRTMDVFTGLPFLGSYSDGLAYAKIYLKSTTKSKKTILDYSLRSMVADIGGYTGLLLGVSFVHFTGLVDQLYQRIWG